MNNNTADDNRAAIEILKFSPDIGNILSNPHMQRNETTVVHEK